MSAKIWDPFKRALEAIPLRHLPRPPTPGPEPTTPSNAAARESATRTYTFTNTQTAETRTCTLTLTPRGPHHPNPTHWWLTHLDTT
jgi:hypothetical protein